MASEVMMMQCKVSSSGFHQLSSEISGNSSVEIARLETPSSGPFLPHPRPQKNTHGGPSTDAIHPSVV